MAKQVKPGTDEKPATDQQQPKKQAKKVTIGTTVLYYPNGKDPEIKSEVVPAMVVSVPDNQTGVNLRVFTDAGGLSQWRSNIPAAADEDGAAHYDLIAE